MIGISISRYELYFTYIAHSQLIKIVSKLNQFRWEIKWNRCKSKLKSKTRSVIKIETDNITVR